MILISLGIVAASIKEMPWLIFTARATSTLLRDQRLINFFDSVPSPVTN